MKLSRIIMAGAVLFATTLGGTVEGSLGAASASGYDNCLTNDGCVASGTVYWTGSSYNYTGEMRGFVDNTANFAGYGYRSGNGITNNVRSVRNRNSTYVSYCVYNLPNQSGILGGANNWSWDGYGNVTQGAESTWFRVQSYC